MTAGILKPQVDVAIESASWEQLDDLEPLVERAIAAALAPHASDLPADPEVSVVLADDGFVADLNARWRGQAKPTNVLSFPANDPNGQMLGDIVVAFETTAREAADEGKTLVAHLTHLLVHGTLHLLGLDHLTTVEAEAMEEAERAVLATLGVSDPYADGIPEGR